MSVFDDDEPQKSKQASKPLRPLTSQQSDKTLDASDPITKVYGHRNKQRSQNPNKNVEPKNTEERERKEKRERIPKAEGIKEQESENLKDQRNGVWKQNKKDSNNPDLSIEEQKIEKKQGNSRGRRGRRERRQLEQAVREQPKRVQWPPFLIKARQGSDESLEEPLQQFVTRIYSEFESKNWRHNQIIQSFLEEDDQGNIEYKLKLVNPTEDRLDHLATQMKFRVKEGLGEAYYRIGVQDSGKPLGLCHQQMLQSLRTVCLLASRIHVDVMVVRVIEGLRGLVVELLIRKIQRAGVKLQIRLLLFGESGSGKSTLLSVLKSGQMDDGKGLARVKVFTHRREFMTGATQSRSHHVVGFDAQGRPYNQQSLASLQKWLDNANKVLTFIDVGGHKKAQKQLVSSLCSFFPQYALWVISGRSDGPQISTNNLELAAIFRLPLIVVITHLDQMSRDQELEATLRVKQVLKRLCPDKTPCVIKQMEYAVLFSRITSTEDVIPIFLVSSVTGRNLKLLTNFLNLLTSVSQLRNNEDMNTQFSVSDKYQIENNIVLAGTVIKGTIKKGQILHLGPDTKGAFRPIEIVSIQCLRVPVKLAKCGQICTLAIRLLAYSREWLEKEPNAIRRGMVLVESKANPRAVWQFLADFTPYSNTKEQVRITHKHQPVINTLTARQICNIVTITPFTLPHQVQKKKSRSIEFIKSELSRKHHTINQSTDKSKKERPVSKKSIDISQEREEAPRRGLAIITEESTGRRKRQVEQIRFTSGETTTVRLRFKYYPEYITVGQRLVINQLKLIGRVRQIFY